jgi:hypothetical protein
MASIQHMGGRDEEPCRAQVENYAGADALRIATVTGLIDGRGTFQNVCGKRLNSLGEQQCVHSELPVTRE